MSNYFVAVKGLEAPVVVPNVQSASVSETGDLMFADANGVIAVWAAGQWLHGGDLAHKAAIEAATAAHNNPE